MPTERYACDGDKADAHAGVNACDDADCRIERDQLDGELGQKPRPKVWGWVGGWGSGGRGCIFCAPLLSWGRFGSRFEIKP